MGCQCLPVPVEADAVVLRPLWVEFDGCLCPRMHPPQPRLLQSGNKFRCKIFAPSVVIGPYYDVTTPFVPYLSHTVPCLHQFWPTGSTAGICLA